MILKIGSNPLKNFPRLINKDGFTFIEVMVALSIFSLGILMIFKSYFISLDRMSYLTDRLYASINLDNRILLIERILRVYNILPIELEQSENINVAGKDIAFTPKMKISDIENFPDVFKLDLSLKWNESGKEVSLSRTAYISDFKYLYEE